jgi:hypothetical protein
MRDPTDAIPQTSPREPWNKGKFIGAKPPFPAKARLVNPHQASNRGRTRHLAMFNLAKACYR